MVKIIKFLFKKISYLFRKVEDIDLGGNVSIILHDANKEAGIDKLEIQELNDLLSKSNQKPIEVVSFLCSGYDYFNLSQEIENCLPYGVVILITSSRFKKSSKTKQPKQLRRKFRKDKVIFVRRSDWYKPENGKGLLKVSDRQYQISKEKGNLKKLLLNLGLIN